MNKIVWKVSPAPTGPYGSFQRRGWPTASFGKDGRPAAQLFAENGLDYQGSYLRKNDLGFPLKVMVTHLISGGPEWEWVTMVKRVYSIREAKELVETFYQQRPHHAG